MTLRRPSFLLLIVACFASAVCSPSPDENASKIFFFDPPTQFQDREQYFDSPHYVATLTPESVDREGTIRFDQPYLNFSQSVVRRRSDQRVEPVRQRISLIANES